MNTKTLFEEISRQLREILYLILVCISPSVFAQNQFFTDFSEYTTGELPDDWTRQWDSEAGTWIVDDVTGSTGGKVLRVNSGSGNARRLVTWNVLGDSYTDFEVYYRFRLQYTSEDIFAVTRGGGSTSTADGYRFGYHSQSVIKEMGMYLSGTFSSLSSEAFTPSTNTWYNVRARNEGNQVKIKIWPVTLAEPDTWDIETTNSDVSGSGWIGLFVFRPSDTEIDVFGVGVDGASAPGQTVTEFTTAGQHEWKAPPGVRLVQVEVWGGGGAGARRRDGGAGSAGSGGGGGGGAYARSILTVTPGQTYTVNVGAGGRSAREAWDIPFSHGEDSWFNNTSTILAKGGSSAVENSPTGAAGGQTSSSIGDVRFSGGNGADGSGITYSGGGGSSAGTGADGNTAIDVNGATAPGGGGDGGDGVTDTPMDGFPGKLPGGGGGGALKPHEFSVIINGGSGAAGSGRITILVPSLTFSTITANPATVYADGLSSSAITVELKDQFGNNFPIGGDDVKLFTTAGSFGPITDNEDGTYTATLTSSISAEIATITGTVNGEAIDDNATVDFLPDQTSFTTAGQHEWEVPAGVRLVQVEVWGGGGAGARWSGSGIASIGSGGGGGGGAYARSILTVTTGQTYTVNVGSGGRNDGTFTHGGDSWFNNTSTLLAKGGSSAAHNSSSGVAGGQASSGIGDERFSGGNGANGSGTSFGGGGGSSAGTGAAGTTATNQNGAPAPEGGGDGGGGRSDSSGDGTSGNQPGGGGGGALKTESGTGSYNGGFGAAGSGRIIILYPSLSLSTLTANPMAVHADGTSTSIITVQLKDQFGNNFPIGGDDVVLYTTAGSLGPVTDNDDGIYTATLTSTTNGEIATITATISDALINDQTTVEFVPSQEVTVNLSGNAGWRMLAPPVIDMPISVVSGATTITGFDETREFKNFYTGYNGSTFTPPPDLTGELTNGRGFIIYPTELPVTFQTTGYEPIWDVSVSLHSDGLGLNLLGNPFASSFDVTKMAVSGGSLKSSVGQIWKPDTLSEGGGSFVLTTDPAVDGIIAPWQGFFIENDNATGITLPLPGKSSASRDVIQKTSSQPVRGLIALTFSGNDEKRGITTSDRAAIIYFHENATDDWDLWDASKFYPLSSPFAVLSFSGEREGETVHKAQESRPYHLTDPVEIPVNITVKNMNGEFTLSWERWINIPDEWNVYLIDTEQNNVLDMRNRERYSFMYNGDKSSKEGGPGIQSDLIMQSTSPARFKIVIDPDNLTSLYDNYTEIPLQFALYQNYPNPFNSGTKIRYDVADHTFLTIAVYDVLGRRVNEPVSGFHNPGTYEVYWDASALASGLYIYRMNVENAVFIKRMVLVQ